MGLSLEKNAMQSMIETTIEKIQREKESNLLSFEKGIINLAKYRIRNSDSLGNAYELNDLTIKYLKYKNSSEANDKIIQLFEIIFYSILSQFRKLGYTDLVNYFEQLIKTNEMGNCSDKTRETLNRLCGVECHIEKEISRMKSILNGTVSNPFYIACREGFLKQQKYMVYGAWENQEHEYAELTKDIELCSDDISKYGGVQLIPYMNKLYSNISFTYKRDIRTYLKEEKSDVIKYDDVSKFLVEHPINDEAYELIGSGAEGFCFRGPDNKVYKIFNYEDAVKVNHDVILDNPNEVIKKSDCSIEGFAFPEEVYILNGKLFGYKADFIPNDMLLDQNFYDNINTIDIEKLIRAVRRFKGQVDLLSREMILIEDLSRNLIYDGERIIAIDTCGYRRVDEDPSIKNNNLFYIAIMDLFRPYVDDELKEICISNDDYESYIREIIEKYRKKRSTSIKKQLS